MACIRAWLNISGVRPPSVLGAFRGLDADALCEAAGSDEGADGRGAVLPWGSVNGWKWMKNWSWRIVDRILRRKMFWARFKAAASCSGVIAFPAVGACPGAPGCGAGPATSIPSSSISAPRDRASQPLWGLREWSAFPGIELSMRLAASSNAGCFSIRAWTTGGFASWRSSSQSWSIDLLIKRSCLDSVFLWLLNINHNNSQSNLIFTETRHSFKQELHVLRLGDILKGLPEIGVSHGSPEG